MTESPIKPRHMALTPCCVPFPPMDFPQVQATVWVEPQVIRVRWEVHDSLETYRCEVLEDGGPIWQDSCVEIFLQCLDGSPDYCNFEFNSRGCCLAARGPDRYQRTVFQRSQYERIQRQLIPLSTPVAHQIHWELEVRIPRALLGCKKDIRTHSILGNIYKCGDKTKIPHYLSAFPIHTPSPDFHRPEYFQTLWTPIS